jgi:DNA-directed RNA polymerase specialized sigma subunit
MNLKCFECSSEENIHHHHVIPKILGGTKTIPLCAACHGKVHDRDILRMSNLAKIARKKEGFKTGRPKKISDNILDKTKKEKQLSLLENKTKNLKEKLENMKRKEELIELCFNDKSLSVKETCKELNISRSTYYREIERRFKN